MITGEWWPAKVLALHSILQGIAAQAALGIHNPASQLLIQRSSRLLVLRLTLMLTMILLAIQLLIQRSSRLLVLRLTLMLTRFPLALQLLIQRSSRLLVLRLTLMLT